MPVERPAVLTGVKPGSGASSLHPDWLRATGLPDRVAGVMSSRAGGVSNAPFDSLNLRPPDLSGVLQDDTASILENQRGFAAGLGAAQPVFLDQVHGTAVVRLTAASLQAPGRIVADASISTERGIACTVLVADCLPVLFATHDGSAVGAAHAGWRGLAAGVLEATLQALAEASRAKPGQIHAWLGACIGPQRFEVGSEVREAFAGAPEALFRPTGDPGKYWADLPGLVRWRLARAGLSQVAGGLWCTHSDASRFFSFRRDRVTGRHAAAIWRV